MLALALLLLAQAEVTTGSFSPENPPPSEMTRLIRAERVLRAGGRSGPGFAFFEAFPASGAGTTGVCSTVAPKGAKGEALTFTRGSTATCTKTATGGLATTGIANGDLVVLSNDVARVEYDFAGKLKLRGDPSRTNSCLRSEQINDAVWIPQNSGSALPVITADQAVAPDGATTADRVQIAACPTATNYSLVQSSGSGQTSATGSLYVKGVSAGGTLGIALNSAGGPNGFTTCTFTNTSWTRCVLSATGAAATTSIYFGCGNGVVGMTSTGAADVYVWGAQLENSTYATSYIPTTNAAITRSVDSAQFAMSGFSTATGFSLSMKSTSPATNEGGVWGGIGSVYQDVLNRTQYYRVAGNAVNGDVFSTSGNRSAASIGTGSYVSNVEEKFGMVYSGAGASSVVTAYRAGVLVATSASGLTSAFSPTIFYPFGLGAAADTTQLVGEFCLDNSLTKCLR